MTDETSAPRTPAATATAAPVKTSRAKGVGLSGKLLPELKQIAASLGVSGSSSLKKAQLVDAIRAAQAGAAESSTGPSAAPKAASSARTQARTAKSDAASDTTKDSLPPSAQAPGQAGDTPAGQKAGRAPEQSAERAKRSSSGEPAHHTGPERAQRESAGQSKAEGTRKPQDSSSNAGGPGSDVASGETKRVDQDQGRERRSQQDDNDDDADGQSGNRRRRRRGRQAAQPGQSTGGGNSANAGNNSGSQSGSNSNNNSGGGGRERRQNHDVDLEITDDDVLVPVGGIVDILDNYAFVRTTGYLPASSDVYVSLSMVRKYGLRKGDALTGQVRQQRENERREKFNPLVRLETVNGAEPEMAKDRPDFADLAAVHPTGRLRFESSPQDVIARSVDLLAPVGKGQRGLIYAAPGSGKTTLIQQLAKGLTANHPEAHLMVIVLDQRPEEITDYQRSTKGEVVAAAFDRLPADQVLLAELALERAKRLVELGIDVVVLFDGLTSLADCYGHAAPSGGRGAAGGSDGPHGAARYFGSARAVEDGGSLTMLATVDPARYAEHFVGSANQEIHLLPYAGIDAVRLDTLLSHTRQAERLLGAGEAAAVHKVRKTLVAAITKAEAGGGWTALTEKLRGTASNMDLLSR